MNGKVRTGAFPQERAEKKMSFNPVLDWKGMYDPRLIADCRCADGEVCEGLLLPWVAISSVENWGSDAITPQGFIDGETSEYKEPFIPFEEMIACDIFGDIFDGFGDDHNDRFSEIEEDSFSHSSKRQKDYQEKNIQEVDYDDPYFIYADLDLPSRTHSRDSKKEIRTVSKHGSFSHGWRGSDKYKSRRTLLQ